MVDLTKQDAYEEFNIPDCDVETCLKVIRTLRNYWLHPNVFNASAAILLSEAHKNIHELAQKADSEHLSTCSFKT